MGEETKHEEERKVMCVPEHLEGLLPYLVVGGCVHQEHDKQHEVTSNAARLGVVYLLSGLLADF